MDYEQSQHDSDDNSDSDSGELVTAGPAKRAKLEPSILPTSSITVTSNPEVTQKENEASDPPHAAQTTKRAPPPIFLRSKEKCTAISRGLADINVKFSRVTNRKEDIKFQPETKRDYRVMVHLLEKAELPFHTFHFQKKRNLKLFYVDCQKQLPKKTF
ncbi:hypothetical protein CBL_05144 [Carabus blaptoides fortunei]